MPISKDGKLYFTDEQYKKARVYSALEYAKAKGYDLVKEGNLYSLREHDSMKFTLDGKWFWNSRNLRGGALEFIQEYEGKTLPEAVNILTGDQFSRSAWSPSPPEPIEKKPFVLPEKSPTFKRLFAYLVKTRGLDLEIVQKLVQEHRIYESIRQYPASPGGELREAHNVVFVGLDEQGQPRSGFQRGTNTGVPFKRDVAGSEKQYAFCCPGYQGVNTVAVFEAAIDAISHATLEKINGRDWRTRDRIALGGVAAQPLIHYLQHNPQIRRIELCLDGDGPGQVAAERLCAALHKEGYTVHSGYIIGISPPPEGKDWNEYLLRFRRAMEQGQAQEAQPPPEICEEEGLELM